MPESYAEKIGRLLCEAEGVVPIADKPGDAATRADLGNPDSGITDVRKAARLLSRAPMGETPTLAESEYLATFKNMVTPQTWAQAQDVAVYYRRLRRGTELATLKRDTAAPNLANEFGLTAAEAQAVIDAHDPEKVMQAGPSLHAIELRRGAEIMHAALDAYRTYTVKARQILDLEDALKADLTSAERASAERLERQARMKESIAGQDQQAERRRIAAELEKQAEEAKRRARMAGVLS